MPLNELGANLNLCDSRGMTPLQNAISKNSRDMVCLLKDLGADINFADGAGRTPLLYAIAINSLEMVRLLLTLGADANLVDKDGWTPFIEASMSGKLEIAEALKPYIDQELNTKIQKTIQLAHVWGLRGTLPLKHKEKIINVELEGMYNFGAMEMLKNHATTFFEKLGSDDPRLSLESRSKILEALNNSFPLIEQPDDDIVKLIKSGKKYVIEGGSVTHAIGFVFKALPPKMIQLTILNRGNGRESLACKIYKFPISQLTPELISKFKNSYKDIKEFKEMLKGLDLSDAGGYNRKDQNTGNCTVASGKAIVGELFRQEANSPEAAEALYKEFTKSLRLNWLADYLQTIKPPDQGLLDLVYDKLISKKRALPEALALLEKSGFKRTPLTISQAPAPTLTAPTPVSIQTPAT